MARKKRQRVISNAEIELVVKEIVKDVLARLKAEFLGNAVNNFTAEQDEVAAWFRAQSKGFDSQHRLRECVDGATKLAVQTIKDLRAISSR